MTLALKEGPAVEPVTLDEARNHLRVENSDENDLISSLITAARLFIEAQTARAMIAQVWTFHTGCPPSGEIEIPLAPVIELVRIRQADQGGGLRDIEAERYAFVNKGGHSAYLRLEPPASGRFEIEFKAGYGTLPANVPAPLRQAILQAVALWFEERGSGNAARISLPPAAAMLIAPFKKIRI